MPDDNRGDRLVCGWQLQNGLAFGRSQPGLGKSDPAGAEPRAACGEHQVFRSQRAVFNGPRDLRRRANQNEHRRVIENVEIRIVQYLAK